MTNLDPSALAAYVATQRWYGANDQTIRSAHVLDAVPIVDGVQWVLLVVEFASGEAATYQLVLEEASGTDVAARSDVLRWMFPTLEVNDVQLLEGEQSNTSLVVDGTIIVKLFRRVGERRGSEPRRRGGAGLVGTRLSLGGGAVGRLSAQ